MRKREVVWEDPRFRSKKAQPKALKINKFGEAPCSLPPAHVPAYATASIPSGMTSPPCPRPAAARGGPGRSAACKRPPPAMSRAPARPGMTGMPSSVVPPPAKPYVIFSKRPPPPVVRRRKRPESAVQRPGTAVQRPGTARAPPPTMPCPPSRMASVAPPPCPAPCPPPPCPAPCPPPPCPAPCPPPPCPAPCPTTPRRTPSPPCPPRQSAARFSGLPRRGGLRPPSGRSGLRPPTAALATSMVAMRPRSPQAAPCPPDPCPPDPCPPDPCPEEMMAPCPPQVSTPQTRRPSAFQGLRPPSRLMGPGASFSRPQPKPQKIVLLPGDINPHETTVITVEPQQQAEPPCRPSSQQSSMPWENMMSSVPFDFSPPSMASFRREEGAYGLPPAPYIPPEVLAMAEASSMAEEDYYCPESPSEFETPIYETSSALLVDVEPFDPCSMEPRLVIEPVDLITFPAPDPFSPERAVRPQSPSCTPPPNPFSPPKDPIPEPSELDKWYGQYPRYKEAFKSSFHPVSEWAKLKHQKKCEERQVKYVDRELVARSVPFNKNVSAICKDDDYDEDLGLMQYMPDLDENFNAPLDYAAIRRQEEIDREEREARRRERERQERGPTLAETRALLERIREAESARRTELAGDVMSTRQPAFMTQEEMRACHDRVMARHAAFSGQPMQQQQPSDMSCLERAPCDLLDDIQLDECDLDALDYIDECNDF